MGRLQEFTQDRDAALLSLEEERITAYMEKWGERVSPSPDAFWAGVHMARVALRSLPPAAREQSRQWLADNGWERCEPTDKRPMGWRRVSSP